jgi:acyl transferase domain-containing protein/thioesterase domain-containing protein
MAGRFPGARNVTELWRNLRDGIESISFLSNEQLRSAGVSANELASPDYVKAAAVLEGVDLFDAEFFGFSPKDASIADPQHRHFLESSWEALENAGWSPDQFVGRIGVFAGSGMNSYLVHNLLTNAELVAESGMFLLKQTANDKDVLSTRVSYQFGLTGPSLSVQTACSTSLVAIHLACQSLLNHECDMALAGGVTIEIPHGRGYIHRQGEILSHDGHCRAFDAAASGTIFGSGAGVVVLRRLEDALSDGDFIHAIVRGTAINNDGSRKVGYLAPSVAGQAEVIAEALAIAGVKPETISYVETHGTGTAVGDPIEIKALSSVFGETSERKSFCAIGSLKTNIGHLDAASGVAGFIKTVLALQHAQIPASLNFSKANPLIDFANSPFFVNTKLRAWEANGHPRRAGITSLGIGGTNAHVVLEEAPVTTSGDARPYQLLTLSARSRAGIGTRRRDLAEHLSGGPLNLADVAYTCHLGRKSFGVRLAVLCRDKPDAVEALLHLTSNRVVSGTAPEKSPTVVFLFSGQGAQYAGMGRSLYESEPEFKKTVDFCAEFLRALVGVDLRRLLFPFENDVEEADRCLSETRLTQPALFLIEYAMAKLWQSWGVRPEAMIGHSIGEFVAACVAGVFSLEAALEIVAERARLMQTMPNGAMVAVTLPEARIRPLLEKGLSLAGVNSPKQCVVSGPEACISKLESSLASKGVACQRLRVSHAFHSSMMDPILAPFREFLDKFDYSPPRIRFISNVTGNWITTQEACDPDYWTRQLRDTVRYSGGISRLQSQERAILLEVGPGRTLLGLAAQHHDFANSNEANNDASSHLEKDASIHDLVASMRSRNEPVSDLEVSLLALGRLWVAGRQIDWRGFHAHERRKRLPLPTYPFEHKSFWIEPKRQLNSAQAEQGIAVDGSVAVDGSPAEAQFFHPVWRRSDLDSGSSREATGPWLIFHNSDGLGLQIAELAHRRGEKCVEVVPGKEFAQFSDDRFQIDFRAQGDYVRLITALNTVDWMPRTIVHLWSVVAEDHVLDELNDIDANEHRSFYSLLFLAQALGAVDIDASVTIGVVANSLQAVAQEPILGPERAVLLGPCGVIPKEFPNIDCRSIDIAFPSQVGTYSDEPADAMKEIGAQIISELSFDSREPVVAYRRNRRWVRAFEPLHRAPRQIALVEHGVYLITGGLGGIGLALAQSMAHSARARLVLMSRGPIPRREEWDSWLLSHYRTDPVAQKILAIQSIERSGGEVMVMAADVSDADEMRHVIDTVHERFGRIDGVIHAAGVLEDAPILNKDTVSASRVLTPKIKGTFVLESVLADDPPALFVVMSSISALIAPPGQIDYAAASAFLDAFAAARSSRQRPIVSIQWPRWRDVGIAADSGNNPLSSTPSIHPLLQRLVKDDGFERVYESELNLEKDWIVGDHRLHTGAGIFPGTAYVEMVRGALAAENPRGALSIRNLRFEVPLKVDVGTDQPIRLSICKQGSEYTFTVTERAGSESGDWITCARGDVAFTESPLTGPKNLTGIRRRCKIHELRFTSNRQNAKQERYIFFGPRWLCLKRLFLGNREALCVVELPSRFKSDLSAYHLHPAILDVATGAAMFLIPGYDRLDSLYVPITYGTMTVLGALPAQCYAHIRATGDLTSESAIATFDISVLDNAGRVIVEIEDYSIQRILDPSVLDRGQGEIGQDFVKVSHQSNRADPHTRVDSTNAISSQEGIRAFEKILSGWFAPNITISRFNPSSLSNKQYDRQRPHRSEVIGPSHGAHPEDAIEKSLANWWKELLGLSAVGTQVNFFEVGGQSLSAIRLLAKIKKVYGLELNPAIMFEVPTIAGLARLIREKELQVSPSSMIARLRYGSGAPLFLIHALGGRVIGYRDLLKHLKSDHTVYGVEFDLADAHPNRMRMEFLAANYIRNIRSVQPRGPYHLVGYSFGGLLAFEIAHQLHKVGDSVAFLGMLDTWQPRHLRSLNVTESSSRRLVREIELRILRAKSIVASRDPLAIRNKLGERALQFVNDSTSLGTRIIYSACGALGFPVPKLLQRAQDVNWFALARYTARQYPGRIVLFRAEKGVGALDDRYGDKLGWDGLAQEGVEVHTIPGSHLDLMREPNVRILARALDACLEQYGGKLENAKSTVKTTRSPNMLWGAQTSSGFPGN